MHYYRRARYWRFPRVHGFSYWMFRGRNTLEGFDFTQVKYIEAYHANDYVYKM
jgi:hypothetical protein